MPSTVFTAGLISSPLEKAQHLIWALKSDQVLGFPPSPWKPNPQQFMPAFFWHKLPQLLVRGNKKAANLTLEWGEGWEEATLSRFTPKLCAKGIKPARWSCSCPDPGPGRGLQHWGTECPLHCGNTVVPFCTNKARMAELKEILLHFSPHSVNRVPGLAPSANKGLWVFELELNTKNTTIRFPKPRGL